MSRRLVLACAGLVVLLVGGLIAQRLVAAGRPTCINYCVAVTPDGDALTKNSGAFFLTTFTVTNTGSNTDTYEYLFSCTGGAACVVTSEPAATLASSESGVYKLAVTPAGVDFVITARAVGTASDSGYKSVSVVPVVTLTAPALTSDTTALVYSRMPLVQARFTPADSNVDTTSIVVVVGSDTVTGLTRFNQGLVEWELDSLRQLTPGVLKKFSVRACLTNGQCKTATRYLKLDDSGKPFVSFGGMPLEALGRISGAPLGPGIAVSGADVETGFAVPSFISMGSARSTGLVYSTRTSHPRALINTDVELTWPAGTPDQIKAVLLDGATRLDSVVVSSPGCSASVGRRCRIALQGDFAGTTFATPTRKWLKVEVSVTSSGTTKTATDSVEAVLVDNRTSRYGNGWAVAGVLRLVAAGDDRMIVAPNGLATIYRGNAGRYLSPPGEFSGWLDTAGNTELRPRGGGRLLFNSDGWLCQVVDGSGNATTIAYASAGKVSTITDPTSHAFTFSYDGGGKLTTITDPGSRTSIVTINGSNQLTYDSLSSPTNKSFVTSYAYTGTGSNSAVVLGTLTDALAGVSTVAYSARYRPIADTLPAVLPETGGSTQKPVVAFAPAETRALGTLISADSVYATAIDPLGNWTRSVPNRWGAPVLVWDALGTLSRASYNAVGFPMWAERKVADSTRVANDYDTFGRLVRTVHWKDGSHRIRLDSLVYDANHNVTQRIDARGKVSRFGYDAYHRVIWAATPNNDTSRTWYRSNGLADSSRSPGQTTSRRFLYDGAWKNLERAMNTNLDTLTFNAFDSLGRTNWVQRRLIVSNDGSWWSATVTTFNAANQVDSVRTMLADPFTESWPDGTDSSRFQQVRYRYDKLGRTTVRYDTRHDSTTYAYDALGRLRSRRPPSAVQDSFRYDLAGRVKYQWTARGVQITHYYDSRGRDTMTTVPGLGDYRSAFGGPNDELTRSWIASYVDSIGGVNPAASWVYSQAGLLLADTAQGSRLTQYTVDYYGRDSITTDAVGAWALRYEANRGLLDTIVTPFSDTLTYSYGSRGEMLTSPSVRSGPNHALVRGLEHSPDGRTYQVGNALAGSNIGTTSMDQLEQSIIVSQVWVMGPGYDPDTLYSDAMGHDGWGRLLGHQVSRHDTLMVADTFSFDVAGNLGVNGESRTYATGTNRLTARTSGTYTYDNAGNQITWAPSGGSTWTYTYDPLDRLVAVRYGATLVARYAYDVLGRRIARRVYNAGPNSATTEYVRMIYRGGQVTAETDSAGGSLTLSYTWGLGTDDLVAIHKHSNSRHLYVLQDNLHSVRGLVVRAAADTVEATWRYRAYGELLDAAGSASVTMRYGWIGREFDPETGFYYVRARYYDPATQRFTQEDPIGFAGGSNVYAYGDGNPTNGRDLSGLSKTMDGYSWYEHHCAEFTAGCTGDSDADFNPFGGGAFARTDVIAAKHDIQRISREEYLRGYDARVASGAYGGIEGARALSPAEFLAVKEALIGLAELRLNRGVVAADNALAVTGLRGMFASGRIGATAAFQYTSRQTGATASWNGGNAVIAVTPLFFLNKSKAPFALAHEFGHILTHATYGFRGTEVWADHFAVRATGQPQYCGYTYSNCQSYRP